MKTIVLLGKNSRLDLCNFKTTTPNGGKTNATE
jgi:hypothetical protein